jgi:hypothetical protein
MGRFWHATRTRFSTARELLVAFWNGPYWWMVPMVLMLLMASVVFIALQAAPLIAPFVYAFF